MMAVGTGTRVPAAACVRVNLRAKCAHARRDALIWRLVHMARVHKSVI